MAIILLKKKIRKKCVGWRVGVGGGGGMKTACTSIRRQRQCAGMGLHVILPSPLLPYIRKPKHEEKSIGYVD